MTWAMLLHWNDTPSTSTDNWEDHNVRQHLFRSLPSCLEMPSSPKPQSPEDFPNDSLYSCACAKDRVVLENPQAQKQLDELLMCKYPLFIKKELERAGYPYSSVDEIPIESKFIEPEYSRALTFMIFDHVRCPFFRGAISCSKTGFFLEKGFFLGLPKDTNPSFLFRILGDERLTGNPPTLDIQESTLYPEWNACFHITLHSGTGFESGVHGRGPEDSTIEKN